MRSPCRKSARIDVVCQTVSQSASNPMLLNIFLRVGERKQITRFVEARHARAHARTRLRSRSMARAGSGASGESRRCVALPLETITNSVEASQHSRFTSPIMSALFSPFRNTYRYLVSRLESASSAGKLASGGFGDYKCRADETRHTARNDKRPFICQCQESVSRSHPRTVLTRSHDSFRYSPLPLSSHCAHAHSKTQPTRSQPSSTR